MDEIVFDLNKTTMQNHDTIHIFFAANVGYYQHLCVLLVSILENNKEERFAFHVMTDREDVEAEKIKGLAATYPNFGIEFVVMDDSLFAQFPLLIKHISLQMYYRFMIPLIAAPELEKALYFDCDMVCNIGLRELWEIPIDDNYLGGCSVLKAEFIDPKGKKYLESIGFPDPQQADKYICSGMLLMNLEKIRSEDKVSELLDWCRRTPHSKYTDQDAVNCVFYDRIKLLDLKWNYTTIAIYCHKKRIRTCIAHFIGPHKPWKPQSLCRHYLAPLYRHYWERSPYRDGIKQYKKVRFFTYPFLLFYYYLCPREVIKMPERLFRWCVVKPIKNLLKSRCSTISG